MNQTIKQSQAILNGLRLRATLATTEMYQLIGRDEPAPTRRFQVVPRGDNAFAVIERATGNPKGECTGHGPACALAEQFEQQAMLLAAGKSAIKGFGWRMARWTFALATAMAVFALYGATR